MWSSPLEGKLLKNGMSREVFSQDKDEYMRKLRYYTNKNCGIYAGYFLFLREQNR
jgi:hypothetical protein